MTLRALALLSLVGILGGCNICGPVPVHVYVLAPTQTLLVTSVSGLAPQTTAGILPSSKASLTSGGRRR